MAHKGKRWPVMFRRGITLNVTTYKFAFAEQYDVTPDALLGSLGLLINGKSFRCSNPIVDSAGKTIWTSSVHTAGGQSFIVRLIEEIIGPNPQLNFVRWELTDALGNLMYARQYFRSPNQISAGGTMGPFETTTKTTPGVIYDLDLGDGAF